MNIDISIVKRKFTKFISKLFKVPKILDTALFMGRLWTEFQASSIYANFCFFFLCQYIHI